MFKFFIASIIFQLAGFLVPLIIMAVAAVAIAIFGRD
jgi:hypothetical protein